MECEYGERGYSSKLTLALISELGGANLSCDYNMLLLTIFTNPIVGDANLSYDYNNMIAHMIFGIIVGGADF